MSNTEEREAAIAFILDRVEQYKPGSGYHAFAAELVAGLAEARHVECARAGDFDDLRGRVRRIMRAHENVTPLVKRPKLRSVR